MNSCKDLLKKNMIDHVNKYSENPINFNFINAEGALNTYKYALQSIEELLSENKLVVGCKDTAEGSAIENILIDNGFDGDTKIFYWNTHYIIDLKTKKFNYATLIEDDRLEIISLRTLKSILTSM